jgi:hypothetical protein
VVSTSKSGSFDITKNFFVIKFVSRIKNSIANRKKNQRPPAQFNGSLFLFYGNPIKFGFLVKLISEFSSQNRLTVLQESKRRLSAPIFLPWRYENSIN